METIKNPFEMGTALIGLKQSIDLAQKSILKNRIDLVLVLNVSRPWAFDLVQFSDEFITRESTRLGFAVKLNMRIVIFGDIYMDAVPFVCSSFYNMPEDADLLTKQIARRHVGFRRGFSTKSGLEALYIAMHSDWDKYSLFHIVVIITENDAYYPSDVSRPLYKNYNSILNSHCIDPIVSMPYNMDEMRILWRDSPGALDRFAHRLAVIAPTACQVWPYLSNWDNTVLELMDKELIQTLSTHDIIQLIDKVI